jgi:excisionase family DNA binding protein
MKRKIRTLEEVIKQNSLLTVPEVAQALCLSEPSIYGLAKSGKLPCIKLGGLATRFDPRDVEAFKEAGRQRGVE